MKHIDARFTDDELQLVSGRLRLEPLALEHADLLYERLCDPSLYTYIPQEPPTTLSALRDRYSHLESRFSPDQSELWLNWVIWDVSRKRYVGTVEASVHLSSPRADIAYMTFTEYWKQCYATEACGLVLNFLFGQCEIVEVEALVDTRNDASIKLLEKLRFSLIERINQADFFKGSSSDEYRYRLTRFQHRDVKTS